VARHVADGLSSKEVARLLRISPLTVRTHRRTIFAILDVHSVAGLARQLAALLPPTPSE
jgi:DNA-binding CsgD family transcriptional regulator